MRQLLLCTDLDRTLLPNGEQAESPRAKELFERLVGREDVTLAYVTGRHRGLIEQAIQEYNLPVPDFAIGDVGTTIYQVSASGWTSGSPSDWTSWSDWQEHLSASWPVVNTELLKSQLQTFPELTLQEAEKQNRFKLSFYVQFDLDLTRLSQLKSAVQERTAQHGLDANLVWSVDQENRVGLLDILPVKANKLKAIEYLMQRHNFQIQDTLFAGDSGNDMDVFRSNIPSVLVANAEPEIKRWALERDIDDLYVASGNLFELNGNYRAGILEGACHYWPEVRHWLENL